MAKPSNTADLGATLSALPFVHSGFAHPSAADAKGYAGDDGRATRTLANVVFTIGYPDRKSAFQMVGASVKAITANGATNISVTFPTMKRGTMQVIQTESAEAKEQLAALKLQVLKAFKPWWDQNRSGVRAASVSTNGVTAADLGIEI